MSSSPSLILSLQDEPGVHDGVRREQVFDCRDGSIGRADECDWVLRADGVSRLHALVRYLDGLYFIEDRSTNGMVLNGASLRRGEPAALKHGDRVQIDTFEIGVRLAGDEETRWSGGLQETASVASASPSRDHAAAASAQSGDSLDLSLLLGPRRTDGPAEAGHADGLIPGSPDAARASLDPLAMFDAPSSYFDAAAHAGPSAPGWNHTPSVSDRFQPPSIDTPRASGPMLPDDWDRTGTYVAVRPEPHGDDPEAPAARASAVEEAALPAGAATEAIASAAPASAPVSEQPPVPADAPAQSQPFEHQDASTNPPTPPPPDLADLFHIAIDAMMDVLRARAELKNSFRLPATLIQRSENNPLKFAPTAQEAVAKLFAPPNDGFLSGSAALNDAADDIRNHQMAMLAGVRAAFQSMLAHFDPARIEESEGSVRRLPLGGRPRHWERYKEQFDALSRHPDECFQRLFGDEFARAYEEQLTRLKTRRR